MQSGLGLRSLLEGRVEWGHALGGDHGDTYDGCAAHTMADSNYLPLGRGRDVR